MRPVLRLLMLCTRTICSYFSEVFGELFAYTRANYPFNVPRRENISFYDDYGGVPDNEDESSLEVSTVRVL